MRTAIDLCGRAADAVAAVDLRSLSRAELAAAAVELTKHLDRMKALHAAVLLEADRAGAWQGTGARNLADWLASQTGTGYGELVGRVRLGDALEASPVLAAAVSAGEVSAATAEVLFGAVTAPPAGADVAELVSVVRGATPGEARTAADAWRELHSPETAEQAEDRRWQARSVRFGLPVDGLVSIAAVLPTLDARLLRRTLGAVAGKPSAEDGRTTEQRLADGLTQLCAAYAKGAVTGGRENASLLIHTSVDIVAGRSEEPGWTVEGDRVPAHVVRRWAEDARLQRVLTIGNEVLELGRISRFATDAQWRALVLRDGGCRMPGCRAPATWCDVDHLVPWELGGPTDLANLVLWCRHHHTEKHRPGVRVLGDALDLRLRLADGTIIHCPPERRGQAAA